MDPGGRKGGTTRHGSRAAQPPTSNITLPKGTWESSGEVMAIKDPELGPEVTCFLRGSAENSEEEKAPSPKPPVKELHK